MRVAKRGCRTSRGKAHREPRKRIVLGLPALRPQVARGVQVPPQGVQGSEVMGLENVNVANTLPSATLCDEDMRALTADLDAIARRLGGA